MSSNPDHLNNNDAHRIESATDTTAPNAAASASPVTPAAAAADDAETITTATVFVNECRGTSATTNDAAICPANVVVGSAYAHPQLCHESLSPPPVIHEVASNTGSIMCRICHNTDRPERLISPCLCKGTLSYVHRHCLEYWLSRANILHCELCLHEYKTKTTLRYQCCESVRIWFRHPNNRGLLQSDLMVCSLLTIVTFGLVSMSLVGLQYFMMQGNRMGFSNGWTKGSLITFLAVIVLAYLVNIGLIARAQIAPWYRWWRSVRLVKVILPKRLVAATATPRHSQDAHLSSTA